jgi:hypothetical protein
MESFFYYNLTEFIVKESESIECTDYRKECLDLFKKLRYPIKSLKKILEKTKYK